MYITYENLKTLVSSKALLLQYVELADQYQLFAIEGTVQYSTIIYKSNTAVEGIDPVTEASRISDFEINYKTTANQPLEIKAGAGRPIRVSASPQPLGTVEHWKGYQIVVPVGQSSGYVDVSFSSPVYVHGGYIVSPDVDFSDYVGVDVLLTANSAEYIPGIISTAYMIPNVPVSFESEESMQFPTSLKLRVTLTIGDDHLTDVHANILVDYFI